MTPLKTIVATAAVAAALLAIAEPASARGRYGGHHHGHHHHGAHFSLGFWGGPYWGAGYWGPGYWGSGYWGPGYWGSGYWAPPAVVYAPAPEPRVWVERDQASTAQVPPVTSNTNPNAQQWWYWCASSRGYYPYVSNCAEGWQRVAPQPQGAQ